MPEKPVAVSMGDPSGIGPDIILKAWNERNGDYDGMPNFFIVGDKELLARRAKLLDIRVGFVDFKAGNVGKNDNLKVLSTGISASGKPGSPDSTLDAACTTAAIDMAVGAVIAGSASAVVTCPINKDVLYKAGFQHPGHTEYLGKLAQQYTGKKTTPVMMLAGPELRTVPVTIHIPLAKVQSALTKELIVETAVIVADGIKTRFGVSKPRIAIAGLNPHAGENGSIGQEENEIVKPAVEALKSKGLDVRGPLPADTMFHKTARKSYDVALCMYHDQALIPAKMIGFDDAVNVTLGLPFIRTSPDHGTAYDIAGTGKANPSSFVSALRMAAEMADHS